MTRDAERRHDFIILIIAIVAVVLASIYGAAAVLTDRACVAAGYPSSKVTVLLERYCVKRVDQTDQVVPAP